MNSSSIQLDTENKPRRRWLQFTMRGLIVLMILTAVGAFWLRSEVVRAREQRLAAEWIQEMGGNVSYAYEFAPDGDFARNPVPPGPKWLEESLGENLFLKVQIVGIDASQATDADMTVLAPLDDLETLVFFNFDPEQPRIGLGDETVKHVADMVNLKTLVLAGMDVTDEGAKALRNLTELETVTLDGTRITDNGLANLRNAKSMSYLTLKGLTGVTDAGLAHLKDMDQMDRLELCKTGVAGPGLQHLAA